LILQGFGNISITEKDIEAKKPNWSNQAFSLKTKKEQATSKVVVASAWDDASDDQQINEQDLLQPEDLVVKSSEPDCGTGKEVRRKACKNCSCGLAQQEEKAKQAVTLDSIDQQASLKSACGNCYLGDAFRCSDCPYLGLPPFKPGEKVQVASLIKDDI